MIQSNYSAKSGDNLRVNRFSIRLIVFIIMLLPIIALVSAISLYAESVLNVTAPDSVDIGHSFDINLSLDTDVEIYAIQLEVHYNSEFLSFRNAKALQSGTIKTDDSKGNLQIIILYSDTVSRGDILTLSFTAKTGNPSSIQTIDFDVVQVVNNDLQNEVMNITESVEVEIIRKSDTSTNTTGNVVSNKENSTRSKANVSSANNKSSSSKVASKSNTSSNTKSSTTNSDGNSISEDFEGTTSVTTNLQQEGFINSTSENKWKYIFIGAVFAVCFMVLLMVVFRLGQMSITRPPK